MNKKRFLLIAPALLFTLTSVMGCSSSDTVTVKFDTDGGTAIADVKVKKGEKVSRPATDPTKDGYTFINWFDAPKTSQEANIFNFDKAISADTTIYAHYTAISVDYDFTKNPINVKKGAIGQAQIEFKDTKCLPLIQSITWTIDNPAKIEKDSEATDHMWFKFKALEATEDVSPAGLTVVVKTKGGTEYSKTCFIYISK